MIWKTSGLFTAVLLAGAQLGIAQAPGAPAGAALIDPTGKFDLEVALGNGRTGTGRLVITGVPGNYQGTLAADGGQGPLAVTSVSVVQDTVLVRVAPPEGAGEIVLHLKFNGPGFAGRFDGMESGQIKGSKVG